ncbi:Rpn family recombination-promoting nuclease/putative transposase [Microcoleus sp. LEGE 07076]|uniref:Rpn family recombination-promoting nuclease/putative transposase n=1 Tax=Microcoleus sp. LEGE 07076 TaxID=915322 RepID=UPI00187E4907|nr:Rpn family recombination-promoting nuclease/putative transposase [Microcoleus sp. LEGE 07076]MBE9188636.1 Rpn family recombination-promoting nuclease/putative transposase [Microcoleus sp. LEGE 07076]
MRFINPKIDFAFKKIFSSSDSKDILINFLNAILYEAQPVIEDLEIIKSPPGNQTFGVDTQLDVKATIKGDRIALIEIQLINVASFGKRVLYNAAKSYSVQLTGEERYERLKTVVSLKIADFEMFENQPEFLTRFVFKEKEQQFDYPDTEIELVFIELPKFSKELGQLETTADQWIYLLKNTSTLETIPETLKAVPEIHKALIIASEDNFNQKELNELQNQELWIQDQQIAIDLAKDQVTKSAQLSLILRQIVRRLGTIKPETENCIRQLGMEELEELGDAVLDFKQQSDLTAWLQANAV